MTEDDYLKSLRSSSPLTDDEYGDEDQNTLMQIINEYKEKGDYTMEKNSVLKVNELIKEIENYEQVISDASGAMYSAESELIDVLTEMENEKEPTV